MSRKLPQIVVLCEDRQQEAFVRRFLELEGWGKHQIRIEKSPKGKGAAEQWVRDRYPTEVSTLRAAPHIYRSLVVIRDGDTKSVKERLLEFDRALEAHDLRPRQAGERIALIIPCRNIETWIAYLEGHEVDERATYPKLARERDCAPMVVALKRMCDQGLLRPPAPHSLQAACDEYQTRVVGGQQ